MKKIITFLLCLLFAFSFCACGNNNNNPDDGPQTPVVKPGDNTEQPGNEKPDEIEVTIPTHESKTRFVNFTGSDEGLNSFLNEFAKRHMRDSGSMSIGTQTVGGGTTSGWREWDSMIGGWWDASYTNGAMGMSAATNDLVNAWLRTMTVDNQGYVWCDNSASYSSWGMGWAFPGVEKGGKAWQFLNTSEASDWILADESKFTKKSITNGLYTLTPAVAGVDKIELTTADGKLGYNNRCTPFLRVCLDFTPSGGCGEIEDLYVQYITNKDSTWDDKKMVSFSQFCTTGYDISANGNKINKQNYYFPMYLQPEWGNFFNYETGELNLISIQGLRFILKAKTGKIRGTLNVDYVSTQWDDRQINNSANLIIALKNNVEYTRDRELLADVLPRARKCMNFLLNQCGGNSGLVSTEYLVGHFNDGSKGTGVGIGNGYWDMFAFPTVNLYCNTSFYNALVAMNFVENMAKEMGLDEYTQEVTTSNSQMNGVDTYTTETAESLPEIIELCRSKLQTEFWNETTGRFHAGRRDGKENGSIQDHGYVTFNQQMITSGIATEEQAKSIMSWINGERTVAGDNSTGADIYKYEFAPRINTHSIGTDFYWPYSCGWNGNVQNGGTALQCAYYDVTAESYISANTAFAKLKNIQAWFEKVKTAGGEGLQFYRAYYKNSGVKLQGGVDENGKDQNGVVGVDFEFLEAALLFRSVPDSFFCISSTADGTLCYAPNVPDGMEWQGIENLVFDGYYYDVAISKNYVQIYNVSEYTEGSGSSTAKLQVSLNAPASSYKVYVNGKATSDYTVVGGKVVVKVPFGAVKVEIR